MIGILLALALAVPNPKLTPGVTRPLTLQQVCSTKWGKDKRFVSDAMKLHVATAYGIKWEDRDQYEFDHLIPRSLAGADNILNLWPQPLAEAKQIKDPLEVRLGKQVCRGELTLAAAQQQMRQWGRSQGEPR